MKPRSKPTRLFFQGQWRTLACWSRKLGLNQGTVHRRLRQGCSVAEALTPGRITIRGMRPLEFQGLTQSLGAWARQVGLKPTTLAKRLKMMTITEALTMPHYDMLRKQPRAETTR